MTMNMNSQIHNGKTLSLLHECGGQGTGSFQSWHINEYDVGADSRSIPESLENDMAGPLPLFPKLDRMPGSASAMNDAYTFYCDKSKRSGVSNSDLDFELVHGKLMGYKTKAGGDDPFASFTNPTSFSLANNKPQHIMANDALDHIIASAKYGWHAVNDELLEKQRELNFDHNRGDATWSDGAGGRHTGLERLQNPAIFPENPWAIPLSSEPVVGTDDGLKINNTRVEEYDLLEQGVVA